MLPHPPPSHDGTTKETKAAGSLFKPTVPPSDGTQKVSTPAPQPFNPNTPLPRRSFISPEKTKVKLERNTMPDTSIVQTFMTSDRPLSSPIPAEVHPEFSDIRSKHWPDTINFLRYFKASLLTYIPDGESHTALPVRHTYGVDGLTASTTAFPDPSLQDVGYGMYFSVNGFKSNKSRAESNLYSLNAFYADIDWPDKKNPPTN